MPELPEVETVALGLRRSVVGLRIGSVRCRLARVVAADLHCFQMNLRGRIVEQVRRYGKYLFLLLDRGVCLAVHLRMTGQLLVVPAARKEDRHTHLEIRFRGSASKLVYRDVRTFGRFELAASGPEQFIRSKRLGPDALKVAPEELYRRLRASRRSLKAALLDQKVLAGLGNIYTDEILFRAGLSPLQPCEFLTLRRVTALAAAITAVLREAIRKGGTTISDYVDSQGRGGRFQRLLCVYGRAGHPCPRCGAPIARQRVAGRSTCYCPRCQRSRNRNGQAGA